MRIHEKSHTDHLTPDQLAYIAYALAGRDDAFFIATLTLPAELGGVSCGLHGPAMGDGPVSDSRY